MTFQHGALIRFVLLYSGLFSAFGLVSPFLPAFLASRGLPPEHLGLGLGTAVRLVTRRATTGRSATLLWLRL